MSNRIMLSFGHIDIVDFPTVAISFLDFPDNHVLIGTSDPIQKGETADEVKNRYIGDMEKASPLYYQLYVVPPRERLELKPEDAMAEARDKLMAYARERYEQDGLRIIGGLKRLDRVVLWAINPAAIKKTTGTVQLIHGVSSGNREFGTTNMELYFPRSIYFRMFGRVPNRPVLPASFDCYSGNVTFAKREYRFRLAGNDHGWSHYASRKEVREMDFNNEKYYAYVDGIKRITNVMAQEVAAAQIREHMYLHFPFIKDYDMLGELRFDPVPSVKEHIDHLKGFVDRLSSQ